MKLSHLFIGFLLTVIASYANAQTITNATQTAVLNIDFMETGARSPEIIFNEAVNKLDAMIFGRLSTEYPANASPTVVGASATIGDIVIVPSGASGEWSTREDYIAQWQNDETWEYFIPQAGWTVQHKTQAYDLYFDGSNWGLRNYVKTKQIVIESAADGSAVIFQATHSGIEGFRMEEDGVGETKVTMDDSTGTPGIILDSSQRKVFADDIIQSGSTFNGSLIDNPPDPGLNGWYMFVSNGDFAVEGSMVLRWNDGGVIKNATLGTPQ